MYQIRNLSILLGAIALTGLLSACSSPSKHTTREESPVSVTVTIPSMISSSGVQASGQIEAGQTAMISTRVMGYVTSIHVKIGDHVNKGQLLATISNEDLLAKKSQVQASMLEAEAAARISAKDLDRFTQLYDKQSASIKELENVTMQNKSAQTRFETAKQMLKEVDAMLAYTRITAPFTGVITQKFTDAGSIANPGMPLLALEQTGGFQAVISVSEVDITKIQKMGIAKITVKSTGDTITAPLSEISPSSQFSGGQFIAKIAIPDQYVSKLRAGMYVNVLIEMTDKLATESLLTIPIESIVTKEDLTGIYIVGSDNHAILRWVRLGKKVGNRVEVLSGLSNDEAVVLKAQGRIYNGAKLTITK